MVYGSLVPDLNNNRQPIEYWVHFVYSNWTRFRYDGINPPIIVPNISEIRGMEIVAENLYIADPIAMTSQTIAEINVDDGSFLVRGNH